MKKPAAPKNASANSAFKWGLFYLPAVALLLGLLFAEMPRYEQAQILPSDIRVQKAVGKITERYLEISMDDERYGLGRCSDELPIKEHAEQLRERYVHSEQPMPVLAVYDAPYSIFSVVPGRSDPFYVYGDCAEGEPKKWQYYISTIYYWPLMSFFGLLGVYVFVFLPVRGLLKRFKKHRPRRYMSLQQWLERSEWVDYCVMGFVITIFLSFWVVLPVLALLG